MVRKEDVALALKEKREDGLRLLNAWLDQEQARVEKGEIRNLDRNVAWAELYRDAGLREEAREAFEAAAEEAFQERDEERLAYCEAELEKL